MEELWGKRKSVLLLLNGGILFGFFKGWVLLKLVFVSGIIRVKFFIRIFYCFYLV